MFAPQSSVSRQGTAGYRPDLNPKIPDQCPLDTVGGFQRCTNASEAWTEACDEIDRKFGEGISRREAEEYVKVAAGFKSECGNARFTDAVRVLSEKTQPEPDFRGGVTRDQVNLLVTIYATVIGATNAFLDCGDLNQAGFVGFTARSLNTTPDAVRDAIPAGRLDGIVLEEEVRSATGTGCEVTERKVRLREAQCWVQVGTACGFEVLPAEMHGLIFEYLPSRADHQRLAATSRAMHEALREQLRTDRIATWAENLQSLVEVCRLLGAGDDAGESEDHVGAIGELRARSRAEVLSTMVGRVEQFHPADRPRVFDRIMDAMSDLLPAHQGRPLMALARNIGKLDVADERARAFERLIGLAYKLSDEACAALIRVLAESLWKLLADDRATMFDRLLTATNELRCRNENQLPALPLDMLGYALSNLTGTAGQEGVKGLFGIIEELPEEARSQALEKLVSDGGALDRWHGGTKAMFNAALDAISGLPSGYQVRPLAALSGQIRVLPDSELASVANRVLDMIQELERDDVTAVLILAFPFNQVIERLERDDKHAMFDRILVVTRSLLEGDRAQTAEIPVRRLFSAHDLLPYDVQEKAWRSLLDTVKQLPADIRGTFPGTW